MPKEMVNKNYKMTIISLIASLILTWRKVESVLVDDRLIGRIRQCHQKTLGLSRKVSVIETLQIQNHLQTESRSVFCSGRDGEKVFGSISGHRVETFGSRIDEVEMRDDQAAQSVIGQNGKRFEKLSRLPLTPFLK